MVDTIRHRGVDAFQGIYGDVVTLVRNETPLANIPIDGFKTENELKTVIDTYLDNSGE